MIRSRHIVLSFIIVTLKFVDVSAYISAYSYGGIQIEYIQENPSPCVICGRISNINRR